MANLPFDFNGPIPTPPTTGTGYLGAAISATQSPNPDLPPDDFPSLRRIVVTDLVGPFASNAQDKALEKRDEYLRGILVKIQATLNVIDTQFLRRDASASKDATTGIQADMPMNTHKLTGLAAGSANGDSIRYEQLIATNALVAAETARALAAEALLAPLASPALTGVPTGPTAAPGTNTTQLATTAFVLAQPLPPSVFIHTPVTAFASGANSSFNTNEIIASVISDVAEDWTLSGFHSFSTTSRPFTDFRVIYPGGGVAPTQYSLTFNGSTSILPIDDADHLISVIGPSNSNVWIHVRTDGTNVYVRFHIQTFTGNLTTVNFALVRTNLVTK